ncbi:DUOX-like protein [Mya arenaria]|uniref:NAD(P)H oxidase (H2O2-forming) n=1 Tax=Mya arenaria TaxID=6604 RepID=A0ABY7E4U8_MYAAR|nr:DUOX-like protein [Mya arenaria]
MADELGDKHVQENPGILSLAVLFFRWHNAIVDELDSRAHHGFDETFDKARQMVIASLQNVIVYEWVPLLLGESLPPYTGYKSDIYPDVTALFDAAAIRYIMTLLPAGINQRDSKCASTVSGKYKGVRMCNTYWRSQDVLMEREDELEETLIGLVSQLADAEDLAVVEDLQSKYFGPLHFSRHDLVSLTIMRGRDYGLPDYNTVIARLEELYGSVDDIDVFVGGMFETTPEGPGELFKTVIRDQFIRIRDGDRFWFENKDNGQFSDEEIERIKAIRLYDILNNSTRYHFMDVRPNVFQYSETNETDSCPPIYMHESQLEPCSPHKGYDYFAGSEASYIIVWVSFGLIPLVCLLFVWVLSKCKTYRYMRNVQVLAKNLKDNIGDQLGDGSSAFDQTGALSQHRGTEWQGPEESRLVIVRVRPERKLEVINLKGKLIRSINLDHLKHVHCLLSDNKKRNVVMIRIPKEYDFVIQMTNESQRREFIQSLKQAVTEHEDVVDCHETKEKHIYMQAFTQKKRNQLLERFFKIAFQMDYDPTLDQEEVETRQTRDILEIELTREEFATALAMKSNSEFVENMFSLMDSDHNGYISFREFLNAVVMLSKAYLGGSVDMVEVKTRHPKTLNVATDYTVEREHSGLRALMSYGISTTRGAAAVMSFCFSLLLLTMLRNTITFLRETFLNLYAPFDSIVSFHKSGHTTNI